MTDADSKPLITTAIPTFRRPRLLRRSLRSVLAQTYPNFEVHVFDNHSEDETPAVVQEFARGDSRVKYHCHGHNIGILENFSFAMRSVETPFFSFLSDDDFLLPDFFETALASFETHPQAIFSALLTLFVDGRGDLTPSQVLGWKEGFYEPPAGLLEFLKSGFLTWTAILFRKEVIERVGPLDTTAHGYCDTDFLMRTVPRFPFVVTPKAGGVFVAHDESSTSQQRFETIWPGLTTVLGKATEAIESPLEKKQHVIGTIEKWHERMIARWSIQFTLKKDFESALKSARLLRDHYHRNLAATLLSAIPRVCRVFPPALWAGAGLNKLRQAMINSRIDRAKLPLAEVRRLFQLEETIERTTEELTRERS
jgi:glycosyltransferase involved in cell wall biosynthesis